MATTLLNAPHPLQRTPSPEAPLPTVGRVIAVHVGDDLQAALNTVQENDIFVLDDGQAWKGNFKLPPHPGMAYLMSRAAYDGRLPRARVIPGMEALLARLVTPNSGAALSAEDGAPGWQIVGLECVIDPAYTGVNYNIVSFGWGHAANGGGQHVPGEVGAARYFLDRCFIHHGAPDLSRDLVTRGVMCDAEDVTIRWCRITDIQHTGQDAQGVWGSNGKGNIRIEDCFIAATGQCVFFGGGIAQGEEYVPADITVERNYLTKLPRWNAARSEWDGKNWVVKPTLELKMGRRVRIVGNTFDSSFRWPALVLDAFDQYPPWNSGDSPQHLATAEITDVEAAHNTILGDAMGGVQIWAAMNQGFGAPVKRVRIWNNLALGVKYVTPGSAGPSYVRGAFVLLLPETTMEDIWIEQNTCVCDRGAGTITLGGTQIQRLRLAKNILGYGHGGFSVEGYWTTEDWALLMKVVGLEVEQNALVDFGDAVGGARSPSYTQESFSPPHSAAGEWIIAGLPAVAKIDPATGRLAVGSPLTGLGVDFAALTAAQSAPAPTPTPPPQEVHMHGNFDKFLPSQPEVAYGWAFDEAALATRVAVALSIDGGAPIAVVADQPRNDVKTAFAAQFPALDANHGFFFTIPAAYRDGRAHTLVCTIPGLPAFAPVSFTLAAPTPAPTPTPTPTPVAPLTDAEIRKLRAFAASLKDVV